MELTQILERMESLKQELSDLGISPEKIDLVACQIEEYLQLRDGLSESRPTQFQADAYDICTHMSVATNKNVAFLAKALRSFAEHIAKCVLKSDDVVSVVDGIPPLYDQGISK